MRKEDFDALQRGETVAEPGPCPNCGDEDGDRYGVERVCWPCFALLYPERTNDPDAARSDVPEVQDLAVVSLADFVGVDEPGAAPLVGSEDSILIPEGGDVMIYGDGGAGKTTLTIDLACHLACGREWIELPIPRAVRVLLIENEGPRPLFRRKLRRKADTWGEPLDGVHVLERPWGRFTFAAELWRERLAQKVIAAEIDVLIAGPLTRIGMDEAGTLPQVRAFMELVADVRQRSLRPLTVLLVHHENKAGAVSGAWEGAGDTLLHIEAAGNGHTIMVIQKARWSSEHHHQTIKLTWAEGDGFRREGDRDLLAEVEELLSDGTWRTLNEVCAPVAENGIGASKSKVKALLDDHPEKFQTCTGDAAVAAGRHRTAVLWRRWAELSAHPTHLGGFLGVDAAGGSVVPPKGNHHTSNHPRERAGGGFSPRTTSLEFDPLHLDLIEGKEAPGAGPNHHGAESDEGAA